MNNYLLSIDPSIKDTGFVLWERYCSDELDINELSDCNCKNYKPIWVNNYNFEKFNEAFFYGEIDIKIRELIIPSFNSYENCCYDLDLDIYIERGFNSPLNSRSRERMESLRGNIYGLFNKLYIPKEHGILPRSWQSWYKKNDNLRFITTEFDKNKQGSVFKKWDKELSLKLAQWLIKENNWNIDIKNNHNIADALLIGWYVINNDNN